MWISGGKSTQYAGHAMEGTRCQCKGVGGAKAEDGDASKNVRKESRCRAKNNTQKDSKLCCMKNLWRSKSRGRNQQVGGKG